VLPARADEVALAYAQDWLRTAEISFREAEQLERSLAEDVRSLESELVETNLVLARIDDLERERNVLLEVIGRFGERITDLGILDQTGGLNLHQLETRTYARPVYPDEEAALVYALGGSIILAFALVLVRGLSDRRVREVQQVPALLGTSVLGVLPELSGLGRGRLARLVEEQPDSLPAEAIRSARTATNFALPEDGRGVVLVTSAASGEGKSVCASNLAFALARAGKKTLLVDGDLRRPAQHEIYGVPNRNGLADLLASSLALRKALVPNVAVGLDLLCAGEARGRASELCEGPILPELIASLRQQYEVVLIDGPPVLESSEARVVATLSDAVVFVLRLEHSTAPAARRALGILRGRGARLLGTLVNGARSKKGARDYAGGISYGDPETAPRRARAAEGEAERGPEPERGRGTDFLGLEEESA
jgi:capsular exopolysaccharide synthesis family protein